MSNNSFQNWIHCDECKPICSLYIFHNGPKKFEKYCIKYVNMSRFKITTLCKNETFFSFWNGRNFHFIHWDGDFLKLHFFWFLPIVYGRNSNNTSVCTICTVVLLLSWGVYLQNSAAITLIINIRLNEQFHRSLLKLVQVLYVLFLIWKNVCHSVEWLWKKGKGTYIHTHMCNFCE